ncbi:MAG: 50S ribosomal protein L1 [Candidatus Micrarchaeota archaeon]
MKQEDIMKALNTCLEDKGKRKFTQSVEFVLNFKDVDFTKQTSRLNLSVALPNGTGKVVKLAVFAEGQLALDAKKLGADLIMSGADIPELAKNKIKLKLLMKDHVFFAQPNLMMQVGKNLGQVMGVKDKLPKPIVGGSLDKLAEAEKRTIKLKSKGKYLPVASCLVGNETMPPEKLVENITSVYDAVSNSVGKQSLKSAYVKLTMGKPVRVF